MHHITVYHACKFPIFYIYLLIVLTIRIHIMLVYCFPKYFY